ncbi:hypothetical protein ACLOJK_033733 [Asimina triloba]
MSKMLAAFHQGPPRLLPVRNEEILVLNTLDKPATSASMCVLLTASECLHPMPLLDILSATSKVKLAIALLRVNKPKTAAE